MHDRFRRKPFTRCFQPAVENYDHDMAALKRSFKAVVLRRLNLQYNSRTIV